MDAIKFIFDRIEGKVLDRVQMEGANGGNRTVTYKIEYVNDWRLETPAQAIERDGRIAPFLPNAPETDRDGPGAARDEGSVRSDVPAPEPGPAAPAPAPKQWDPKVPD
ncbi:MAG TPA: hypothetical protein VKP69_21875 [Isosphaeraceae bacterium]|nr:hypothetical protein [Isosphaeraceae bacterium]